MKILLLDPPGRLRYSRDYYLSAEVEADLVAPPQDLVSLSGTLSALAGASLEVLDEQLVPRADVTEVREASIDRAAGPLIEAERREKLALDERLDCERLNGTRTTIACSLHEEQRRGTAIRRLLQRALA